MRPKQECQAVECPTAGRGAIARVVGHERPQDAIELWGEVAQDRQVAVPHVFPVEQVASDVEEIVDHPSDRKRVTPAHKQGEVVSRGRPG